MQIQYPKSLVDQVQAVTKQNRLEGFVPGEGVAHPRVMLVGEAPGQTEIETGHPFVGASGKELTKMLALAGLTREEVYITSVVRSRPFAVRQVVDKKTGQPIEKRPNRTPTKREVAAFAPLFDWELAAVDPEVIVPLGNTALQRLLGKTALIGDLHGQVLRQPVLTMVDGKYCPGNKTYVVIPMYHPAAYLYARRLEPTVQEDWREFGQWLNRNSKES